MVEKIPTRNVSLTPEIEAFIVGRVASGRFRSASEVVRAALRLLEENESKREAQGHKASQRGKTSAARRLLDR